MSLTRIRSMVSSASECEAPRVVGGIALSESFGAIFAPDVRRLGAKVSRSADWRATTGPATVSWLLE